jgi:LPS-assembly lipoprotein
MWWSDSSPQRRAALAACAALAATTLVSACGFKLRDSAQLPFRRLHTNLDRNSVIGAEFRSMVRVSSDTVLVDRIQDADARLEVLSESREREIVGFTSTGRPREYQLRLRYRFRVLRGNGQDWLPATELLLYRDITATDIEIVTKQQEEELLYREMQSDVVQQLLRRLSALKP